MRFLMVRVAGRPDEVAGLASVWVDVADQTEAEQRARAALSEHGHVVTEILENALTSRDDYFPPCKSLDAFEQAEREGLALIYS